MSGAVFFTVPAGTQPAECGGRSCRATIYWIVTGNGRRMPVDVDVEGGHEPSEQEDGQGVSHFASCPDAQQFRRAKR